MSEKKSVIDAKKKLERENQKEHAKSEKKRDFLSQNLHVLNELAFLVHENRDKSFNTIYNEFIKSQIDNEEN